MRAAQKSSKLFSPFFTSFDRARAADHEKLVFRLRKCFFPAAKCEILEGVVFQNMQHFLFRFFFNF
jgi:hypothetical protein